MIQILVRVVLEVLAMKTSRTDAVLDLSQSARALEYTDCISAEG